MKASILALLVLTTPVGMTLVASRPVIAAPANEVDVAMERLRAKANALGAPSLKAEEMLDRHSVPVLYFGTTKVNNNFSLVDEVQKEVGGTETIFVKQGNDFIRVSTNVKTPTGERGVGTVLDPQGKAIIALTKGERFAGVVDVLGKPFNTQYEPILDAHHTVIGALYAGYPQ